jgi:ASCH domain.
MHEFADESLASAPAKTRIAVSIRQPWAALVATGIKTVELRRWRARRTGQVCVHAGALKDSSKAAWAKLPPHFKDLADLRRGLIGRVEIVSVKQYKTLAEFQGDRDRHLAPDEWFTPGLFGWELVNAATMPFEPCPGNLRFFRV